MKKTIFTIIFCGIMMLGLTGCGSNSSKATITDNEGNTIEITAKELIDINNQNSARFEKNYEKAKIELTAEVETVETAKNGSVWSDIKLKGNWEILFKMTDYNFDLSQINPGDKIHIVSRIYGNGGYSKDYISIYGDNKIYGGSIEDEIKIEIVK